MAQPPLSQQIRKLEEHVGYPLFVRNSRMVELTAAGEVLLERSRYLLRKLEENADDLILDETQLLGAASPVPALVQQPLGAGSTGGMGRLQA